MTKSKMRIRTIIGILLLLAGLVFLGGTVPASVVSFGPLSVSGISERSATSLWIGAFLVIVGLAVLFPDFKKLVK